MTAFFNLFFIADFFWCLRRSGFVVGARENGLGARPNFLYAGKTLEVISVMACPVTHPLFSSYLKGYCTIQNYTSCKQWIMCGNVCLCVWVCACLRMCVWVVVFFFTHF